MSATGGEEGMFEAAIELIQSCSSFDKALNHAGITLRLAGVEVDDNGVRSVLVNFLKEQAAVRRAMLEAPEDLPQTG